MYNQQPVKCIRLWYNLAFSQYYDNYNVNVVYTENDKFESDPRKIHCLVPSIN